MTKNKRPNGTIKALSDALGISTRQVSTLLSNGMPTTIPEAMAWRGMGSETSDPASDDSSPAELRRRRIALLRKQEARLEMENQVRRGELISRREVEERDAKIGACVRHAILRMRSELPGQLEGLTAPKIATVLDDYNRSMLEEMSDEGSEFWSREADTK
jgi:phage terminase Nu1 subunit (DNA packaging protein)